MKKPSKTGWLLRLIAVLIWLPTLAGLFLTGATQDEGLEEWLEELTGLVLFSPFLIPAVAITSLLFWEGKRLRWKRVREALGEAASQFERPHESLLRRFVRWVAVLCTLAFLGVQVAIVVGGWASVRAEWPLLSADEFRGLALIFNSITLSLLIVLVAWMRTRQYSRFLRAAEKKYLEKTRKRIEKCESYCQESKSVKTRISRAGLGLKSLPLHAALAPSAWKRCERLERYFLAVERSAELVDAVSRMQSVQTERSRSHHRERARELLAKGEITDETLRSAEFVNPATNGEHYTRQDLEELLAEPSPESGHSSAPSHNIPLSGATPPPEVESPPPLARSEPARWFDAGQSVQVQGFVLPDGMLYVGQDLQAADGSGRPEAALVDPALKLDPTSPARSGRGIPVYPSYTDLSPRQRAAYLEWLAEKRDSKQVHSSYALLFLFGLERRLGHELHLAAETEPEWIAVRNEVLRLVERYANVEPFATQAREFANWVGVKLNERVPVDEQTSDLSLELGAHARDERPIPADRALAWARSTELFRWRTPARRCPQEFAQLFAVRYREAHGEGLLANSTGRRVRHSYRSANPTFQQTLIAELDVPDIALDQLFCSRLTALIAACTEELAPYSRHIQDGFELSAIGLLPREIARKIARERGPEATSRLLEECEALLASTPEARVEGTALRAHFPPTRGERWSKSQAIRVCQTLDRLGYGVEPDPRFGSPVPRASATLELFRLADGAPSTPSDAYTSALALVQLTAAVASAQGALVTSEEQEFEERIEESLELEPEERKRLQAHLRWRVRERPDLAGLRKRVQGFTAEQREASAHFLLVMAAADGQVTAAELKALDKLYDLLGLDPQRVHSDLHSLTLQGDNTPSQAKETEEASLDLELVARKHRETQRVSRLLADIFEEEEPEAVATPVESGADVVAGLDLEHSALLRALSERESWTREEFEALSSDLGLLPGGALETLNEAAFEQFDMPLTEGDNPIELVPETVQEFLK